MEDILSLIPAGGMYTATTIDKSEWLPGIWQDEPDEAAWFEGKYPCAVHRAGMGHLCGYVGIPAGHPQFGVEYQSINVKVHGGLTFDQSTSSYWWVGFDCGHSGDISPEVALYGIYRTFEYVVTECKALAEQLHLLEQTRE